MYIDFESRFKQLFDDQTYELIDISYENSDPLKFKDLKKYTDRLKDAQKKTNQKDAALVAVGKIGEKQVCIFLLDFSFMGGSMGSYVGEAFRIACQKAVELGCPFISIASSGGARMQEGLVSLMQLPKTVAAVNLLDQNKIPFISILTHPTTGGVSASFAMLGDIIIAEKGSMIGFAGKRVIEETIKEQLPEDFQTAEYLLDHGMIDIVVHRKDLRDTLAKVLSYLKK
jgi:acetyl-CoA carboxylase carboxyl transferase subunit beta